MVVMEGVEKEKSSLGLKKGAKNVKVNYESLRSDSDKIEENPTIESRRSDNSSQNKSEEAADDGQLVQ